MVYVNCLTVMRAMAISATATAYFQFIAFFLSQKFEFGGFTIIIRKKGEHTAPEGQGRKKETRIVRNDRSIICFLLSSKA